MHGSARLLNSWEIVLHAATQYKVLTRGTSQEPEFFNCNQYAEIYIYLYIRPSLFASALWWIEHVGVCWYMLVQLIAKLLNLFPFPTCSASFQGIPWTQIVPYGRSIGTAPSIHLAREYPVRGVAEHLLHCSWAQNWTLWTYSGHVLWIVLTHVVLSRTLLIRSLFFLDSAESYGVDLSNTAAAWVHESRPWTKVSTCMIETGPELPNWCFLLKSILNRAWRIPVRFRLRFTLPGDIFTNIDKIGDVAQNLLLCNKLF